jgi:serine/threonine protein kinase
MGVDKNRFKIQDDKLFIDGVLTTIPNISSFVSIKDAGERGVVLFAIDNLSRPVAVKVWMQSSDYSEDAYKEGLKEATKLANLEHPNILQVLYAGADSNKRFYSVMKRLDGPTLRDYLLSIRPLEERYTLWFDVARAINYAHNKGIYHGDLHLGNIAVENGRAKVFDFGASMSELNSSILQQNECGQLECAVTTLLPEFDMSVLLPITANLYSPELMLSRLVAWITWEGRYLALKQTLKYHPDDEWMRDNFIYDISIPTSKAPFFNIAKVLERIYLLPHATDEDHFVVRLFLASLLAECERNFFERRGSSEEIRANRSLEVLKIMTLDAWKKWQQKFLSMDRKNWLKVTGEFLPFSETNPIHLPVRWAGPID